MRNIDVLLGLTFFPDNFRVSKAEADLDMCPFLGLSFAIFSSQFPLPI